MNTKSTKRLPRAPVLAQPTLDSQHKKRIGIAEGVRKASSVIPTNHFAMMGGAPLTIRCSKVAAKPQKGTGFKFQAPKLPAAPTLPVLRLLPVHWSQQPMSWKFQGID